MKKRSLPFCLLILILLCSATLGAELPWEVRLPFKEATIQYELKGTQQGTETLYIKDYGKRRAKLHTSTTTVMGMTNTMKTMEITDPDWVYTFNIIDKKGEKTTNPLKLYQSEYSKFTTEEKKNFEKNAKELGSSMMGKFSGSVKEKSSTILGYECDETTVGGMSTVHLLHGTDLPLRSEVAVMGIANSVNATHIDTAAAIPETVFAPPAGITAVLDQETETVMADTVKNVMDTLKRPDGAKSLRQMGPSSMGAGALQQGMEEEGMSKEEQQQLMQQMEEAMKNLQQRPSQQ